MLSKRKASGASGRPGLSPHGTSVRTILGVPIWVGSQSQTVELLDVHFESRDPTIVAFANAHALNVAFRDEKFLTTLRNAVVINDGIGVDIASRLLFGSPFPQNLNGTDFIPLYLQKTRHPYRIFLLGGRAGIAELAAEHLAKTCLRHRIVGCHHGYFPKEGVSGIVDMIKASNADIILVAMGNPQQEIWLVDNLPATGCRLGFGVGALFDFMTGQAIRAPAWLRSARVEWLYRLIREPGRLARRYLIGNPLFLLRVFGQRISGARKDTSDVSHSIPSVASSAQAKQNHSPGPEPEPITRTNLSQPSN